MDETTSKASPSPIKRQTSNVLPALRSSSSFARLEPAEAPVVSDKSHVWTAIDDRKRRKRLSLLGNCTSSVFVDDQEDMRDPPGANAAGLGTSGKLARSATLSKSTASSPGYTLRSFASIAPDAMHGRYPLVFVLTQHLKAEAKARDDLFENQLAAADALYLKMRNEEDAIRKEERRRRLKEESLARQAKQERERQLQLQRRVLKDEEMDRQIIGKIEQRAWEDLLREDLKERQRRQTLHNVLLRREREKKGRPDPLSQPDDHSSPSRAGHSLRVVDDTFWDQLDQQSPSPNDMPESTKDVHERHQHHHTLHPSMRAIGPKGLSATSVEIYLKSPLAPLYAHLTSDPKAQYAKLQMLVEQTSPHRKRTDAYGSNSATGKASRCDRQEVHRSQEAKIPFDPPQLAVTEASAVMSHEEYVMHAAASIIQRVGRGYNGRLTANAFKQNYFWQTRRFSGSTSPQPFASSRRESQSASRPTSALRPVSPGSRGRPTSAGSHTLFTPPGDHLRPSSAHSRATSRSSISSAEHLRNRSDKLLRKLKRERRKLFPKLTVPPEFDDLYENEEKGLERRRKAKEAAQSFDIEVQEAQERYKLPQHVKIYDPFKQTEIRAKMKAARERRLKEIDNETWHRQNEVRIRMTEKLERVKEIEAAEEQRRKIVERKRQQAYAARREQEKKEQKKDLRRIYIQREKHDIERLELHIALREEFMRESRVAALQRSLVEVPGAERIAAMTSALSVDKAKRSATPASSLRQSMAGSIRQMSSASKSYSSL